MRQMKDSGIEWIGQIPQEWEVSKIKHIGSYVNGYAFKPEDWGTVGKRIVRIQDLTGSNDNSNFYAGELDSKYLVRKGDILVSWAATLEAFIWNEEDAFLNQHIFKAIPKNDVVCYDYFFWLLKVSMENMNNDNKHGIMMEHVTLKVFNPFNVPLPLLPEQQAIADKLDKVCGEIDKVIAKTKAVVEEYKKLKQAIITEAVTGEKQCVMRNSQCGIKEKWAEIKLKYLFHIEKRIAGKEGYTVLSITQNGVKQKDLSKNEGQLAENYSGYQFLHPGEFAMNHMDLLTGWVDISKYDGVTSPDYRVFLLDSDECDKRFYLYFFQMCYFDKVFYRLGQGVSGMGRWRLQADKFLNFKIPLPPLPEQQAIVAYLDSKCGAIDEVIAKKQQLIEEMENYKKSVIYEYVTGKKEVG